MTQYRLTLHVTGKNRYLRLRETDKKKKERQKQDFPPILLKTMLSIFREIRICFKINIHFRETNFNISS